MKEAADFYGLILLPRMEITTREEVHLLGYFPSVDAAVDGGKRSPRICRPCPIAAEFFGHQYVMDTEDQVVAEETRMLIGATDLDLAQCAGIIRERAAFRSQRTSTGAPTDCLSTWA